MTVPFCKLHPNSLQAAFLEDLQAHHRDGRNVAASIGHWGWSSGKTTALLMGALLGVQNPGYKAAFFNRSRDDESAFFDQIQAWGAHVVWNRIGHEICFVDGGRIRFHRISGEEYGPMVADLERARGHMYDYIAVDGRPSLGQQGQLISQLNRYGDSRPKIRFL